VKQNRYIWKAKPVKQGMLVFFQGNLEVDFCGRLKARSPHVIQELTIVSENRPHKLIIQLVQSDIVPPNNVVMDLENSVKVRFNQTKQIRYTRHWSYEFTRYIEGETKQDAYGSRPVYSVHMSLLKTKTMLARLGGIKNVSSLFLQRCLDMLGRYSLSPGTLEVTREG
jgi:hypothetical protein